MSTAQLIPHPRWHLQKPDGTPGQNYTVYTYEIGGAVTPKATYQDAAATVSNGTSFTLDARGESATPVYWSGLYYIVVKDEDAATVWTMDNYGNDPASSSATPPNLLTNGSFEINSLADNKTPDGWTLTEIGSAALVSTNVSHGGKSLQFTGSGAGGGDVISSAFINCSFNETLSLHFDYRSSVTTCEDKADILWYDVNKSYLSLTTVHNLTTGQPSSMTRAGGSATPPANAVYCKVQLYGVGTGGTLTGVMNFDNVVLTNQVSLSGTETIPGDKTFSGNNNFTGQNVGLFSTGDVKLTLKTAADTGWVLMDDKTIGNAASGGTGRANADTAALFTLLWTNTADAQCPVSTGRGASAAADYAANKTITLPKSLGRALACYGTGSGLTARVLAETLGEEAHVQTLAEMVQHNHDIQAITGNGGGNIGLSNDGSAPAGDNTTAVRNKGSAPPTGMNVMQPTLFLNVMVKL